jgi:hypothetical protein
MKFRPYHVPKVVAGWDRLEPGVIVTNSPTLKERVYGKNMSSHAHENMATDTQAWGIGAVPARSSVSSPYH